MTIATGQIASTEGDIFTAAADAAGVSILIHNTNTTTETVQIFIQPSGGTSRRYLYKDIPANDTLIWEVKVMFSTGDKVRALTTTAAKVNYCLSSIAL